MAGQENLIPLNKRSKEQQRQIQKKGGKARAKQMKQEKTFREIAKAIMPSVVESEEMRAIARSFGLSEDVNVKMMTVLGMIRAACNGDVKAFDRLAELIGEQSEGNNGNLEKLIEGLKNE